MIFFKPAAAALCLLPAALFAQDRTSAILVMDGSGSMWGQIDGTAKITIAQEVIGGLMTTLPDTMDLGLTVYGHRRKGDCSDIETVVMPGAGTRGAIATAVNSIKPKGKTPMADAVVAAANAMRHTENAATVILVSDGIETCVPDVCAVARTLEETGVDFTAHVVGFDVTDPKALAQFQCMADATGGKYLSASNANELGAALTEVAVAKPTPPPEPKPQKTRVFVVIGDQESRPVYDMALRVTDASGGVIATSEHHDFALDLLPGSYTALATRLKDEATTETAFTVTEGKPAEAKLKLPEFQAAATLLAPATAEAGATVEVTWTGPDEMNDYLDTALSSAGSDSYQTYEYTAKGNPVPLRMPTEPGDYLIRYVLSDGLKVLASTSITVTERSFGLNAPDTAPVGATIDVTWSASGYDEDYVTLAEVGSEGGSYLTYEYVTKGNPTPLRLTLEPGTYELRYINGQDASIGLSKPITLTDIVVTLDAPDTVDASEMVSVTHTGPAYDGDYVTLVEPGADAMAYLGYAYTADGNPLQVPAPETPGTYELRYISIWGDARILASKTVVVE
ncbi:vWA domain-containing protein [Shimia haliotis]|uniref:Ca-activated chloride channel family protein n=1 Tax=Shimia haliotis TaxID=1280847 RepID=A0A1I4BD01_9RHOB|nr:VWA domain-containing protein [Shimia haliotis]SFK65997.1 Ca-activated chloride channel family protein [Shimia haliotis]